RIFACASCGTLLRGQHGEGFGAVPCRQVFSGVRDVCSMGCIHYDCWEPTARRDIVLCAGHEYGTTAAHPVALAWIYDWRLGAPCRIRGIERRHENGTLEA